MRVKTTWLVVVVMLAIVLASAPAEAAWPERYSVVFLDPLFIVDCVDFGRCSGDSMPARAFVSGQNGTCSCPDEFEPARHSMSCTWNNVLWLFGPAVTKTVDLDVTCSRWGFPLFFIGSGPGPGSCGAAATSRRFDQFGINITFNDSYSGISLPLRERCADIFGPLSGRDLEQLDPRDIIKSTR